MEKDLIEECSGWDGYTFAPLTHVRAVNLLQQLGKAAALDAARRFCATHTALKERTRLFLLLRLLFVPQEQGTPFPPIRIGAPMDPVPPLAQDYPLYPLVLIQDVPLLIVTGYKLAGFPEDPEAHIEFCERSCAVRSAPLRPPDDPTPLVDEVLSAPRYQGRNIVEERAVLRAQIVRLVGHVLGVEGADQPALCTTLRDQGAWDRLVAAFRAALPRWDGQQYQH